LAAEASLPEVPELRDYHQSIIEAAARIPAGQRAQVIAFLQTVAGKAGRATTGMRSRTQSRSRALR